MPGLKTPRIVISNQYGPGPALKPALVSLARTLALFDLQLVKRVQKFHQKPSSSMDETRKVEVLRLLEDCNDVRQQWRDIDSGKCQFSELYMTNDLLVPIWKEGLRVIKEVIGSKKVSSEQSNKRNVFAGILLDYESQAGRLQEQMVHAAGQGLFDPVFLNPIQERWLRLDETIDLHYRLCNHDADEEFSFRRQSPTWLEVQSLVQKEAREGKDRKELMQNQIADRSWNTAEPDRTAGSKNVRASISALVVCSCAIAPIPLFCFGYTDSHHLRGTTNDADFWFLIAATLTQLQGLAVSALLERSRGCLPKWRWVIPAAFAGACSIVAIPLYLYIPTEWSSLFSLVAGIIQAFLVSQFFLF
ncbi:hypothetical protein AA0118_g12754 [Alternaria tenuissima]|nr:hypothetical protein AA0118_g12754 [Alternaria tenuissima]